MTRKFFVNAPGAKRRRAKRSGTARRRRRLPPRGRGGQFIRRIRKETVVARKRRTRKRSSARRASMRRNAPRRRKLRKSRVVRIRRRTPQGTRTVKRRSYRRNPSLVATIMRGVQDALAITAGKVGTNLIARNLPFTLPLPGMAGELVKGLGVATAAAFLASKVTRGDMARMITAGCYQSLVEGVIRAASIPVVSTALGEYDVLRNNYSGLGSYATPRALPAAGMGAYPTPQFEGEDAAYS